MYKEIIQIGSSLALVLPKEAAESVHLKKGDLVDIQTRSNTLTIKKKPNLIPVNLWGTVKSTGYTRKDLVNLRKQLNKINKNKWKKL